MHWREFFTYASNQKILFIYLFIYFYYYYLLLGLFVYSQTGNKNKEILRWDHVDAHIMSLQNLEPVLA